MTGIAAYLFAPDLNLSRAEAAVILVRALQLENTDITGTSFGDIKSHWAKKEIEIAYQYGIVKGTGNGKFSPDKLLTRQEMAVMLDRILKLENVDVAKNPYRDINFIDNSWSYSSIVKLTHYNIFKGNPDGTFGAESNTTRGQMAVLMDRIAVHPGINGYVLAAK